MLTTKEFLFLLLLAISGAFLSYSVPDLIQWIKPVFVEWFKYSIAAVVIVVSIIVILFGIFLVWCCAKYGQYQAYKNRKLYGETNASSDDKE